MGFAVAPNAVADAFASHFQSKILSNVNKARVDVGGVYNGKNRLFVQESNNKKVMYDQSDCKGQYSGGRNIFVLLYNCHVSRNVLKTKLDMSN